LTFPGIFRASPLGCGPGARAVRAESLGGPRVRQRIRAGFRRKRRSDLADLEAVLQSLSRKDRAGRGFARSRERKMPQGFCARRPCPRARARAGHLEVAKIQSALSSSRFYKSPALPEVMTFDPLLYFTHPKMENQQLDPAGNEPCGNVLSSLAR